MKQACKGKTRHRLLDPRIREDDELDPSLQIGVQFFMNLDGGFEYFVYRISKSLCLQLYIGYRYQ